MNSYETIVMITDQLSMTDKIRLIEHLSMSLRHDLEIEAYKQMPWHEFIEQTAGSLVDDPIERPPQLPYEEREPLDRKN